MYAIENMKRAVRRLTPSAKPDPRHCAAPCATGAPIRGGSTMTELFRTTLPFVCLPQPDTPGRGRRPGRRDRRLVRGQWVGRLSGGNGIYDYVHYHSRIHEVLGIARGRGASEVRRTIPAGLLNLKAGDVAMLPAAPAINASRRARIFLVVGAYSAVRDL